VFEMADALLFVWYPGEQGGNAVADIIFGDAAPSGRLPVTFPMSVKDLPPFEDYAMKNRTYRYAEKTPLFPFGFGLSYTNFTYSNLKLSKSKIGTNETITVEATVTNTGKVRADEVIQLYLTDVAASVAVPKYALKGFQRVSLWPGASKMINFTVTPDMLKLVNEKGEKVLEKGEFKIFVGGSLPAQRSLELGAAQYLEGKISVE